MSGPTRADLEAQIADRTRERDAWRQIAPDDKEATAIARCVKALDPLKASSSYGSVRGSQPEIARVLHYLAERYGVGT